MIIIKYIINTKSDTKKIKIIKKVLNHFKK